MYTVGTEKNNNGDLHYIIAIQRWTDEMLDNLANSVSEVKESVTELRESVTEVKESVSELRESVKESVSELRESVNESVTELRESVTEVKESVTEMRKGMEILRDTTRGLIEVAAKQERRMNRLEQEQAESNKRFDVLLGEIRYLILTQQQGDN